MLEGYERLDEADGQATCVVLVANAVRVFLEQEQPNDRSRVRKIVQILNRLQAYGLPSVSNTEQFKHEGKFKDGKPNGKREPVYAVKAHQIRVYGGFKRINGKKCFLCIEATRKKNDKADKAQLERVAKALGEIND